MFIRMWESKNTKLVQVWNFYLPFLSWRFFDMRRETHNFFLCWLFHLTPTPSQTTGLALASSENRLLSSSVESHLFFFFFKFQNPQPIASGHDVIHVPGPISYLGFLWHLWLSHPPRACLNTYTQCVHLTKPKGSQPYETER